MIDDARARRNEWGALAAVIAFCGLILFLAPDARLAATLIALAITGIVVWIVWQDLATFTIADGAIAALVLLALVSRWSDADSRLLETWDGLGALVDVILPFGLLYLFREIYYRRKGIDGLGFGDVKLAGAGGLLVSAEGFFWALAISSLLALLYVAGLRLLRDVRRIGTDRLAFGAVLAPALLATWIVRHMPLLLTSSFG